MANPTTEKPAVLRRGDDGYDEARSVFNAMIDRHPDLVLRCASAADVLAGVRLAHRDDLPIAVKGGGHSVAGYAVRDGGLLLDLSPLKSVTVDASERIVVAGAGLTLGELDAATARQGLATPTGIVSVTGLAGLALGGGLGWLNGSHGLTCDNLISAEVVTADGELITASAESHPDLFWALRGGGGNFGVVTEFKLRLHPVDDLWAGVLGFGESRAAEALAAYHRHAATSPDHHSANASVYLDSDGAAGVAVAWCHLGDPAELDGLLADLRAVGPHTDTAEPTRYVDLQRSSDPGFPEDHQHYWKSASVTQLDHEAIATLVTHVKAMPSPYSGIGLQHLHGAAARVEPTATAYPHRSTRYDLLLLSQWPDPDDNARNIEWTNDLFAALTPSLDPAVYVNNLGDEGDPRVRNAYGPNYDRLVDIKTTYDPTNVFDHNHNIAPRPAGDRSYGAGSSR